MPKAIIECLRWFAGGQIRSVATVGGNLANASPISDLNPIWLATGAQFEVAGPSGAAMVGMMLLFLVYFFF